MPSDKPTRVANTRPFQVMLPAIGLVLTFLTATTAQSTESLLSVVSSGVNSTRLHVDLSTTDAFGQASSSGNPASLFATLPDGEFADPNAQVRWVLIPPECGVDLKISDLDYTTAQADESAESLELPGQFARLGRPAILRGYRMVPIYLSKTIRDESSRSIRTLRSADIELDFTSSANRVNLVQNPNRPRPSRYARQLVEELVVNPPAPSRDESPTGGSILYVIGDWDSVADALNPLIEWRRRMGWKVQLLRVHSNRDRAAILSAIQGVYDEAEVTPEYIVLVGDAPGIRGNQFTLEFFNEQNGAQYAYESDQPYVCLEGDDLFPDAAIGRIPFNTIGLLTGIINKTINYEATPYIGQNNNERGWQLRAAIAATDSRSGKSSVDMCNWFKDLTTSHGFTRVNEFFFTPDNQQPDPTDFIANNLTSGVSFFLYRGWADMSGYEPNYAGQLRNGQMLPFVILATCNTGEYAEGNQGSPWTYTERFLTNANGGAIGSVGAAGATHTAYNNLLAAATLAAPFNQKIYSQGWALQQGKVQLMHAYQDLGDIQHEENHGLEAWLTEYYIFNLMGDPAVDLVTSIPRALTVDYDEQIKLGATYYEITATYNDNRAPAVGATVCLYKAGQFQSVLTTDANGRAHFTLDPDWTQNGTIKLTITGRGMIPRLADLNIAQAANMIGVQSWTADDDNNGESHGNDDSYVNPNERIETTIWIKNFGQQRLNGGMIAVLEPESPYATIVEDTLLFDAAPARNVSVSGVYLIDIAGDAPDKFVMAFKLTVSVDGQNFVSSITLPVVAPNLEFESLEWAGEPLIPRETRNLRISLRNDGAVASPAMNAVLLSLTPTITVASDQSDFNAIAANGLGLSSAGLQLHADRWHVPGSIANLALALSSESGFIDTAYFSLPIGAPSANTPFGPDKYGYICIDNSDEGWATRPEFNWIEINTRIGGNGTNLQLFDRVEEGDSSVLIDLPFDFTYYGSAFHQMTVCSNGWAAFGDHHELTDARNRRIPSGEMIPAMLAPFWDDLITTQNNGVFTRHDQANHCFIIEWSQMRKLGPNANGEPLESFQIVLYDPNVVRTPTGDGEIVFQYLDVADVQSCFQAWDTPFATVGIGNLTATSGIEYSYWGHRPAGAASLVDNRAIKFTTASGVPTGYISGMVVDAASHEAIAGAAISLNTGMHTTTDEGGAFFIMTPIRENGITLTATAQFFSDSTLSPIEVTEDDTTEIEIALLKPVFVIDRDTLQVECRSTDILHDSLEIQNSGNGMLVFSCHAEIHQTSVSSSENWLHFSPDSDTLNAGEVSTIFLDVDPDGLADGDYSADLVIVHNARPGTLVVPISLSVSLDAPTDPIGNTFSYQLEQNFPNPFNSTTTISFELASSGQVKLTIIDLTGREQLRLVDDWRPVGRYAIPLIADNLPAGVYFCRLEAGGVVKTRKLALMK